MLMGQRPQRQGERSTALQSGGAAEGAVEMAAIPPSPREGPCSSSHSWTTTKMGLQPAPGEAAEHWTGGTGS